MICVVVDRKVPPELPETVQGYTFQALLVDKAFLEVTIASDGGLRKLHIPQHHSQKAS